MKKHITALSVLLLFIYMTMKPLVTYGFFPMHDDTQVGRVVAMGRSLKDGQFPVRWVRDLGYGYGYPIFNFYAPLPYYAGGLLYALGLSGITATKIMIGTAVVLSSLLMYICTVPVLGAAGATVAAIFYAFVPYKAVQIFVRGAIGESWTLIFLPLLWWSLCSVFGNRKVLPVHIAAGVIALSGIILSHTILGYTTVLILICIGIAGGITRDRELFFRVLYQIAKIIVGSLILTAFYWIPAFTELNYTSVANFQWDPVRYWDHYVCLPQLWSSLWGFAGSAAGCIDGMSFRLGKIHSIAALAALGLGIHYRVRSPYVKSIFALSVFTIVCIFLMTSVSRPLWDVIPLALYIQYPWRFLTYTAFSLSLLSAYSVLLVRHVPLKIIYAIILISGAVVINSKLFAPQYTYNRSAREYESPEELKWRVSKISDEYLPADFARPKGLSEVNRATIEADEYLDVSPVTESSIYEKIRYTNTRSHAVIVRKAYFPGWEFWVNDNRVYPNVLNGLPIITVPQGDGVIELRLGNTVIRRIANCISLIALLAVCIRYAKKTIY